MNRAYPLLAGALALAMPVGPANTHSLRVPVCGGVPGAAATIPLGGAPEPDEHGCCKSAACHVGCDRKRAARKGGTGDRAA